MPLLDSLIGPLASIIDKIIPDKEARAKAKLELIKLEGTQEMQLIEARLQAIVAEAQSKDPWTSRARPSLLYDVCVDPVQRAHGYHCRVQSCRCQGDRRRNNQLSRRITRSTICVVWHRLTWLHRRTPMGEDERC